MNKIIEQTYKDIKSIKIQGATNVALATAKALKRYSKDLDVKTTSQFINEIKKAGKYLVSARDTEPMADNVVEFIIYYLMKNKDLDVKKIKQVLTNEIDYFFTIADQNNEKIIKNGSRLIKDGDKVFTHCHSSTVIKVLKAAKADKKNFEVFQTETRPLYQGHKTANDLKKAGIKDTLVVDSAAPYLISKISGDSFKIDKVIIGCDAISRDGSCVNKVGSYSLALSAALNRIPVYVATHALKINEDAKNLKAIKIEQRDAREVWDKAPKGLKIFNPAFDTVPSELIKGYITEFGVLKPETLVNKIKKAYPWIW